MSKTKIYEKIELTIIALCIIFVISIISYNKEIPMLTSANYEKTIGWGIKRENNHLQPDVGSKNKQILEENNGICMGRDGEKIIYLTFDSGYEAGYMDKILTTLKENNVKATFFITAHYLNSATEEVEKMVNDGHIIGNHTVNHKSMPSINNETIEKEIMQLHQSMYEKFGYEMKYLRPPKGEFNERTLQKTSSSDLEMKSNVELQASILEIVDIFYELYGEDESYKKITIKTAVGSPGFIEVLLNCAVPTTVSVLFIVNTILGKLKDSDGSTKNGIIGLIDEINKLCNDHIDRKKKIAETKVIEENIQLDKKLKQAQIDKINAETRKINAEADALEQSLIPSSQKIEKAVEDLEKTSKKLKDITDKNSIECHKNIDLAS